MRLRRPHRYWLAGLMVVTGAAHFVTPRMYERIVPHVLGDAGAWVSVSGAAQVVGGVLLAARRTRRVGAWGVACLMVLVFPANVQMALDGGLEGARWPLDSPVAAWLRLPFQIPLVLWAVAEARDQPGSRVRARATSDTASAHSP
ncbi:MAG: hypothetical protein M3N28_01370 [Actinomycetota bacterium]|nr:hypothetical protein [Actinomycetota bacterium]